MTAAVREETAPSRTRLAVFGVLAFAVVVLGIPIGRAPIWDPNDARWVLLARDVVEHGHWLVPEIRGVPNEGLYKPHLYTWSIALASLASGQVTEFTAALPSMVSAIAGVAGVVAIGSLLWSVRAGVVAGLILSTTSNYFAFAHHSIADVMMTSFMVWALYFLLRARRDGSLRLLLGFYACVGAAMLSKGPPGLAALLAAVVATALEGGRPALRRLRPAVGALMLGVLALFWIVPYLVTARPAFVHEVLLGEYALWFLGPILCPGLCSFRRRLSGGGEAAQTTGGATSYGGPSHSGWSSDCRECIVPATTSPSIQGSLSSLESVSRARWRAPSAGSYASAPSLSSS